LSELLLLDILSHCCIYWVIISAVSTSFDGNVCSVFQYVTKIHLYSAVAKTDSL